MMQTLRIWLLGVIFLQMGGKCEVLAVQVTSAELAVSGIWQLSVCLSFLQRFVVWSFPFIWTGVLRKSVFLDEYSDVNLLRK